MAKITTGGPGTSPPIDMSMFGELFARAQDRKGATKAEEGVGVVEEVEFEFEDDEEDGDEEGELRDEELYAVEEGEGEEVREGGEEEGGVEDGQGTIHIRNSQRSIPLDLDLIQRQMEVILEVVGVRDHDVSLWLTNDRSIREYNDRYRKKRKATDILSFPFHTYKSPGVPSDESLKIVGPIRDLGDMMVSVAYVKRQCQRDMEELAANGRNEWTGERGASGAMASIASVQGRLPYLIIHGVLHLLG